MIDHSIAHLENTELLRDVPTVELDPGMTIVHVRPYLTFVERVYVSAVEHKPELGLVFVNGGGFTYSDTDVVSVEC